ncbi:MAG: ABC transporter permease subunit [Lachnospiraceae bacterium]|nr:ABC transporter permease subunit [Robinsoniella sp.]MDY3766526.1 ABC transporter permease subunit [Lachnospiraceae bacterium]
MRGIQIVFQKELKRVFKDKKMIFSLFILPVVLMVGIYGLMGYLTDQMMEDVETHKSLVWIQNEPEDLRIYVPQLDQIAEIQSLTASDSTDEVKQMIYDGMVDLLIVFPEDFTEQIAEYESSEQPPEIKTFYNPSEDYSSAARQSIVELLESVYEKALLEQRFGNLNVVTAFTVDSTNAEESTIQNESKAAGRMLGMMLPYLITILLFAGTMSLGTDTITGEKERGTLACMLVTPVKRSEIVLGKLLALTVMSILSASVYIIALVIAMPKALGSMGAGDLTVSFGASQIAMMAAVILALAFLYVLLVAVVSVFARTVKEAATYVTPLYMIVIVAGLFTMFATTGTREVYEYLIPIYSSSICLSEIFANELTVAHFAMSFGMTILLSVILTGVMIKAFNSEKVMFNA